MIRIERQIDGQWIADPGDYPTIAAARRVARALPKPWRMVSVPSAEDVSAVMRSLRAIPSKAREQASRENGKRGGRPKASGVQGRRSTY